MRYTAFLSALLAKNKRIKLLKLKKIFKKVNMLFLNFKLSKQSLFFYTLIKKKFFVLSNNNIEYRNILTTKYYSNEHKELKRNNNLKINLRNRKVVEKLLFDMFDILKKVTKYNIKLNSENVLFFIIILVRQNKIILFQ